MANVSEYKIVTGQPAGELAGKVATEIAAGFQPEGGIAADGGTVYQAMVKREETGTDILAFFRVDGQTGPTTIDSSAHTVDIEVANGTTLGSEAFQMVLSAGASSDLASPQSFSDGVAKVFTITSESGDEQAWEVTITVAAS